MKLSMFGGLPPGQSSYFHSPLANGYPAPTGGEDILPSRMANMEPPLKRLRMSDSSDTQSPLSLPTSQPGGFSGVAMTPNFKELFGLDGSSDQGPSTVSSTQNESTVSTSLTSSVEPSIPASPFATTQPPSAPPLTGISVFDRKKVELAKCRPRSSIPSKLTATTYARQCLTAAYASRLDPYSLHPKEQEALKDRLCHIHVTLYLNIRNGILRLWTSNAMVSVTREEALGCAKEYRWMDLASFAYDWLVTNGYINFGCVETPLPPLSPRRGRRKEGPVIVVVGAGVGGLGCARQLEALFRHYRDSETSPRVIVVEGRSRIGGRVYSHPLESMHSSMLPPGLVPKVDMGAQIITGFDGGNPLDLIVRGQLALHYHMIHDVSTLYDIDGSPVDQVQDTTDEKLYNDVLDRSGYYRYKALATPVAEGDHEMINTARESTMDDGLTVGQWEAARATGTEHLLVPTKPVRRRRGVGHTTGKSKLQDELLADLPSKEEPAALACQALGWELSPGFTTDSTIDLDLVANASPNQNLGAVMDEGLKQYQRMIPLTPKDMRLLNWHLANMEYANATNVKNLSLSGWDQDSGNEFEGEHSQVIGGYTQLPHGLYSFPHELDLRTKKIVKKISYDVLEGGNNKAIVHCEDGEDFTADHVVFTGSLGVLKAQTIQFDPPLPDWKTGAIERLGFGLLNKTIMVFEKPFWDTERNMFGLLREATIPGSMAQEDYAANRGRFYMFWNCIESSGLPTLVALMAGDAAHETEQMTDSDIIAEAISQLRNIFKHADVPDPLESVVTRWASDPFARGSYSYVAAGAQPGDYNLMARNIGNLHFAGEATCGTHPATVHGAYISGLRAASEIIEAIAGPIDIPHPLVPDKASIDISALIAGRKGKRRNFDSASAIPAIPTVPAAPAASTSSSRATNTSESYRRKTYAQAQEMAVFEAIGAKPALPAKVAVNPFLSYQKDFWAKCRAQCDDARRAATKNPTARASRDQIRAALGQMWRDAPQEEKQPYLDAAEAKRQANLQAKEAWKPVHDEWARREAETKANWIAQNNYDQWEPPESA